MDNELPDPNDAPTRIGIGDLLTIADRRIEKLGSKQRNRKDRLLLLNLRYCIIQLVDRLSKYESGDPVH